MLLKHVIVETDRVTTKQRIVSRHISERVAVFWMCRKQRKAVKKAPGVVPRYNYDVCPATSTYTPRHQEA